MIAIIDYDAGNLKSVEKAFEYIGAEVKITNSPDEILNADGVVFPGVGAFADCMNSLKKGGLDDVVRQAVLSKKPFMGICLGFQLLFEKSYEGGEIQGLGIFKGTVKKIPNNLGLKVPHMGWNSLTFPTLQGQAQNPIYNGMGENPYVYFVHSYYVECDNNNIVSARTQYGFEFDVAICHENVFAFQFHPEKSGDVGLRILKNFIKVVDSK